MADGGTRAQHKQLFCGLEGEARLTRLRLSLQPGTWKRNFRWSGKAI
jgi:hypothetical protein